MRPSAIRIRPEARSGGPGRAHPSRCRGGATSRWSSRAAGRPARPHLAAAPPKNHSKHGVLSRFVPHPKTFGRPQTTLDGSTHATGWRRGQSRANPSRDDFGQVPAAERTRPGPDAAAGRCVGRVAARLRHRSRRARRAGDHRTAGRATADWRSSATSTTGTASGPPGLKGTGSLQSSPPFSRCIWDDFSDLGRSAGETRGGRREAGRRVPEVVSRAGFGGPGLSRPVWRSSLAECVCARASRHPGISRIVPDHPGSKL